MQAPSWSLFTPFENPKFAALDAYAVDAPSPATDASASGPLDTRSLEDRAGLSWLLHDPSLPFPGDTSTTPIAGPPLDNRLDPTLLSVSPFNPQPLHTTRQRSASLPDVLAFERIAASPWALQQQTQSCPMHPITVPSSPTPSAGMGGGTTDSLTLARMLAGYQVGTADMPAAAMGSTVYSSNAVPPSLPALHSYPPGGGLLDNGGGGLMDPTILPQLPQHNLVDNHKLSYTTSNNTYNTTNNSSSIIIEDLLSKLLALQGAGAGANSTGAARVGGTPIGGTPTAAPTGGAHVSLSGPVSSQLAALDLAAAVANLSITPSPPTPNTTPPNTRRSGGAGGGGGGGGTCGGGGGGGGGVYHVANAANSSRASSPAALDELPKYAKTVLYKTEACRGWEANGSCRYGVRCQFAHGSHELRPVPRHDKYKTVVCKTYATTGTCPYGRRCRFIHFDDTHESSSNSLTNTLFHNADYISMQSPEPPSRASSPSTSGPVTPRHRGAGGGGGPGGGGASGGGGNGGGNGGAGGGVQSPNGNEAGCVDGGGGSGTTTTTTTSSSNNRRGGWGKKGSSSRGVCLSETP